MIGMFAGTATPEWDIQQSYEMDTGRVLLLGDIRAFRRFHRDRRYAQPVWVARRNRRRR